MEVKYVVKDLPSTLVCQLPVAIWESAGFERLPSFPPVLVSLLDAAADWDAHKHPAWEGADSPFLLPAPGKGWSAMGIFPSDVLDDRSRKLIQHDFEYFSFFAYRSHCEWFRATFSIKVLIIIITFTYGVISILKILSWHHLLVELMLWSRHYYSFWYY